jgi:hypothetical protein
MNVSKKRFLYALNVRYILHTLDINLGAFLPNNAFNFLTDFVYLAYRKGIVMGCKKTKCDNPTVLILIKLLNLGNGLFKLPFSDLGSVHYQNRKKANSTEYVQTARMLSLVWLYTG